MTDLPNAGPELDALVAEALGSAHRLSARTADWSTDRELAMDALERWREQHPDWFATIDVPSVRSGDNYMVTLVLEYDDGYSCRDDVMTIAPTLAEAICQAIVLASREVSSNHG